MDHSGIITLADALTWLTFQQDNSVDMVVTDPAYESLEKHRAVGTTTRLKNKKWFPTVTNSKLLQIVEEMIRILKRGRHLYLFCDDETSDILMPFIRQHPKVLRAKRLIWDKRKIGMGYRYRSRHEFILYVETKGKKRRLADLGQGDVLDEWPRLLSSKDEVWEAWKAAPKTAPLPIYPTEKPLGLVEKLFSQSARMGELVVDPFMGSGVVVVAALRAQCAFAGCDVEEDALALTNERLSRELLKMQRETP